MTFVIAGIVGWLIILAAALCLAGAARRGDELAAAVRRNPPGPGELRRDHPVRWGRVP
jgi:hypothetical protein